MSNDAAISRLWKLQTKVHMLVLDGKRSPEQVADVLQGILEKEVTPVTTTQFSLLADLGIITVPDNYDHATQLTKFMRKNYAKFFGFNDNINYQNFPNPSRILKPGDKLWVRAFQQVVSGMTASEERMAFLATQKAVHTGAQGLSLVFEQKRDLLPKGKWYASFDEKQRLWENAAGDHGVPNVNADLGGVFRWNLGYFKSVWDGSNALLCFCDILPSDA